MKTVSSACVVWLHLVLIRVETSGEYTARFDVLATDGGESRHESILSTALLARQHTEQSGAVAVFPQLNFICPGVIHRVFILGRDGSGSQAPNLTFWQIGALSPQLRHSVPLTSLHRIFHNSATGVELYEQRIEAGFASGDMIGFSQPETSASSVVLKYQDRNGKTLLIDDPLSLPREMSLFPLIAIDSSSPECSAVFPSRESLEHAVMVYPAIDGGRLEDDSMQLDVNCQKQRLFPDLRFTCEATISSLIIGAEIATGPLSVLSVPDIQVWRLRDGTTDTYSRVDSVKVSSSPTQEISVGLAEYRLDDSLSFMTGDILGIYHPGSRNFELPYLTGLGSRVLSKMPVPSPAPDTFQQNTSSASSERQWPLVSVGEGDSGCVEGFMSHRLLSLLVEKKHLAHLQTTSVLITETFIVPGLKFTRDTLLKKWVFVSREDSPVRPDLPHFRVWRATDGVYMAVNGTYTRGQTPARSPYLNVYEYTLDPPAVVLEGDFIGWEQSDAGRTRFLPLLLNNSGYEVRVANHMINDAILGTRPIGYKWNPLIGVQVLEKVTPSVTVLSTTPSETTPSETTPAETATTEPTPSMETDGGIQELLATILGSGIVGILILLGLALMLLFVLWAFQRHRRKRMRDVAMAPDERNLNNPLYTTSEDPAGVLSQKLQNGPSENPNSPSTQPSGSSPAPSYAAPPAPTIRKDGSVQYDEPILTSKKAPQVAPKPSRPLLSPLGSPHYHTIDPQDSILKHTLSPTSSPQYHSLEHNEQHSPLLSPRGSPRYSTATIFSPLAPSSAGPTSSLDRRTSPSLSPFASLNRRQPAHIRETSTSSERQLVQPLTDDPGYDIIEPPRWEGGAALRLISTTSSFHSRTSSRGTDQSEEEPVDHVYHQLTSEGGYSKLHQGSLFVPTKEERQRAATTASRKKINIYAALSEFSDTLEERDVDFFEESETYWKPARDSTGLYDQLARRKYREIMRSQIKLLQHVLGSGNFGEVSKGEWQCEEGPVEVAVKTLKSGSSEEEVVRFLQEAAIMGQFRHPNIVQLLGVVTLREPVMIILELLSLGDIRNHLLSLRPLTPGDAVAERTEERLLGFCQDVASGMEYLERKMFVHRDLAARNILVADDGTCKIGDFGMARDLENEHYYISRGGKIPIRWSPPEALNFKKYTTASDVWSFGIVMYEMWSLGHKPYEGYTNPQIQTLVERGERLAPPPGCPRPIYTLMINCWHPEHSVRPTFLSLLKTLSGGSGELLVWSEGEAGLARSLGAPLDAGRSLYSELQHAYTYHSD